MKENFYTIMIWYIWLMKEGMRIDKDNYDFYEDSLKEILGILEDNGIDTYDLK